MIIALICKHFLGINSHYWKVDIVTVASQLFREFFAFTIQAEKEVQANEIFKPFELCWVLWNKLKAIYFHENITSGIFVVKSSFFHFSHSSAFSSSPLYSSGSVFIFFVCIGNEVCLMWKETDALFEALVKI